jgi:hypothetical protein
MNQAIGKGGFAVVDMSNDGEVADVIHKPERRGPPDYMSDIKGSMRKGRAEGAPLFAIQTF